MVQQRQPVSQPVTNASIRYLQKFRPYQNNVIVRINPLRTQFIDSNDDNESTHTGTLWHAHRRILFICDCACACACACVFPFTQQTRYIICMYGISVSVSVFFFEVVVFVVLVVQIPLHIYDFGSLLSLSPIVPRSTSLCVPFPTEKPLPLASLSYVRIQLVCWFLLSDSIRRDHTHTHIIFISDFDFNKQQNK